jgi:hypothetical protein
MTMSTPILGVVATTTPTPSGATGAPAGTDTGDAFLALVQGLLDGTPGPDATASEVPAGPAGPVDPVDPDSTDQDTDVATEAAAAGAVPVAVPLVPPPVQMAVTAAPVPAVVEGVRAVVPAPRAVTPAAPAADEPAVLASPTAPTAPTDTADPLVSVRAPVRADLGDPGSASHQDPGTSPTSPAPVAAASAPSAAAAAPSAPADTHRVAQQVFPEVVRVVANPDGPRRVTLRLNPESLGEVRVVLTSRRGELEVSLAGGADARRALSEGAPELQRLLDAVGHGDSRITVRDLAGVPVATALQPPPVQALSATTTSAAPTGTGVSTDLTGGSGTGAGGPGAEPGTRDHPRGSSTAMDGAPAPTTPSRRTETVTRARTGLDVTM